MGGGGSVELLQLDGEHVDVELLQLDVNGGGVELLQLAVEDRVVELLQLDMGGGGGELLPVLYTQKLLPAHYNISDKD